MEGRNARVEGDPLPRPRAGDGGVGLGATQIVLLGLTAVVGILTVMPGRATLLQAWVHLSLCAAYLFLAANP